MGVLSYPAMKAQWPEIVKLVHDYSLQRTKHSYSFNAMCKMFGLHCIDSEIKCEEWVFANLGGLCLASEKKHFQQLRLVSRVMINAWLTYFHAPKQYWKEYPQGEADVDVDEVINKSSISDSELIWWSHFAPFVCFLGRILFVLLSLWFTQILFCAASLSGCWTVNWFTAVGLQQMQRRWVMQNFVCAASVLGFLLSVAWCLNYFVCVYADQHADFSGMFNIAWMLPSCIAGRLHHPICWAAWTGRCRRGLDTTKLSQLCFWKCQCCKPFVVSQTQNFT